MGASLLRLHFHDFFLNGCNGSLLLDNTARFVGEKAAVPNNNPARGFNVVDDTKAKLEKAKPGVVSCADILAVAARDLVVPDLHGQGLSLKEVVAFSGSHTIGLARCTSFRGHICNDTNIDTSFAKSLQKRCPNSGNDSVLANLDLQTPTYFDDLYNKNLLNKKGSPMAILPILWPKNVPLTPGRFSRTLPRWATSILLQEVPDRSGSVAETSIEKTQALSNTMLPI